MVTLDFWLVAPRSGRPYRRHMREPQEENQSKGAPLADAGVARHLVHLGMTPDAAKTFAAYHSGAYARFR
jgi:hypothetical protein